MKLVELLSDIFIEVKKVNMKDFILKYKGEDFLNFKYYKDGSGYSILFYAHNSDFNIILWKDKGEPFLLKYEGEYIDDEQEIVEILLKEIPFFLKYNRKTKINQIK